jgi:TetR/AcrR family transcriptional repressor of nem operon
MTAVCELIWTGSYGSTTIDQICQKASVKKGSFYHFFDSKADLAVAAIDAEWQSKKSELDAIFSPVVAPLDRIRNFCDYGYKMQADLKAKFGYVLGCPMFTLGAEVSTQEDRLCRKIQEILDYKQRYLESAIRDAHAAGLIVAPDAAAKARMLFAYFEGILTQARIRNDVEILRESVHGFMDLLGAHQAKAAA